MSLFKVVNKNYTDYNSLTNLISYFNKSGMVAYYGNGVVCCSNQTIINSFSIAQEINNHPSGNYSIKHFIVSIERYKFCQNYDEYKKEKLKLRTWIDIVMIKLSDYLYMNGHQNYCTIHADSEYIHLHYAVNMIDHRDNLVTKNKKSFYEQVLYYLMKEFKKLDWLKVVQYG